MKQVRLKVKGRVQGVFFRAETREQARALELKGYAQNNRDGSVTVVAAGEESKVLQLVEWCRKGPDLARVETVEVTYEKPQDDLSGFEIY